MKAINTHFDGNYFRSRLEARWAHFFKTLRVKYEFEPEGFKSDMGECYLPDFYLPDVWLRGTKGVYVEIKPDNYDDSLFTAAKWFNRPLILFKGQPSLNIWNMIYTVGIDYGGLELWEDNADDSMLVWVCNTCRTVEIQYADEGNDWCDNCKKGKCNMEKLKAAAESASKARFEFGDKEGRHGH